MQKYENDYEWGSNIPDVDNAPNPTSEPRLTQLDEATRQMVLNFIYEYGFIDTPQGPKKEIKSVKYPPLNAVLMHGGSHLNMVLNYTWTQAEGEILFFEGLFYDPLSLYYEDDTGALRVLDAIYLNYRRSIKESIRGSHQDYNVKMVRGHQTQEIINRSENPLERRRRL